MIPRYDPAQTYWPQRDVAEMLEHHAQEIKCFVRGVDLADSPEAALRLLTLELKYFRWRMEEAAAYMREDETRQYAKAVVEHFAPSLVFLAPSGAP